MTNSLCSACEFGICSNGTHREFRKLEAERDELAAIVQDLACQREWQPVKMRGYKSMRMYLACPLCDGDSAEIEHGDSIQDPPSMVHDSHCPIGRARVWVAKREDR